MLIQPETSDPGTTRTHGADSSRHALVILAAAIGLGLVAVFVCQRLTGPPYQGTLQARRQVVTAAIEGRLGALLVRSGDVVVPGQVIGHLVDPQLTRRVAQQRRQLAALELELAQTQARVAVEVEWRSKQLQAEVFETKLKSAGFLKQQFGNQLEQVAWDDVIKDVDSNQLAESQHGPWQSLVLESRSVDERRVNAILRKQAARNAHEVSTAQVELCDERLEQLDALQRGLPEQVRRSQGTEVVAARLQAAREELVELGQEEQGLQLVATTHGVVGLLHCEAGDHVAPRQVIVEILNEEQAFILIDLPVSHASGLAPGQMVDLLFPDGTPGQGRVQSVPAQANAIVTGQPDEPRIRVCIEPAGRLWPRLPFGSSVGVHRTGNHWWPSRH